MKKALSVMFAAVLVATLTGVALAWGPAWVRAARAGGLAMAWVPG
jgi:hypothetical protein